MGKDVLYTVLCGSCLATWLAVLVWSLLAMRLPHALSPETPEQRAARIDREATDAGLVDAPQVWRNGAAQLRARLAEDEARKARAAAALGEWSELRVDERTLEDRRQ